jgi:WD40-like Beta Propeller Repeat
VQWNVGPRYGRPGWSPDGRKIALAHLDRLAIVDLNDSHRGILRGKINPQSVDWSPDGKHLVDDPHSEEIYVVSVDGRRLLRIARDGSHSPDGNSILYIGIHDEAIYIDRHRPPLGRAWACASVSRITPKSGC